MQAGRLRHRIVIEELAVTLDSDGDQVETWVPIGPALPAEIKPLSGRELIAAQAVQSKVATRIVMRYRPGFEPLPHQMRAVHRATVYSIEAVIPDPHSGRQWMTLQCSSGVRHVREA